MATSIGIKLGLDGEKEFRKGLNDIISTTKSLDKQMSALESSFDGEKKSLEENAKQTELLEKKKAALEKQIEETSKALEYAKENYEEGSREISSWEGALADAQKALNETNSKLEENAQYGEEATSALGQLTSTIEAQTSELESLRDAYIDAVLQYGEGSEQANELAGQISSLNSELQANKDRLNDASAAADGLTTSLEETSAQEEDVGDVATAMGSQFGGSIGSMVSAISQGGIVGAIGLVATAIVETTQQIIEMKSEWESGMSTIQIGTGLATEELQEFTNAALAANSAIIGMDLQSASEAVATLSTRLDLTAEDTEAATEAVGQFYKVLGVDTTSAVNNAVDVMYQWGLVTGDSATDTETLINMLDMLVVAQQNAPVSVDQLTSTLSDQAVAYQALGLDMEQTISMIDSYVNRGGNMNDVSTAAYNIFKNLNGEVDDLPATFQEIIDKLSTSTDSFATMSETIGDTGKTIEDVLGAKKAGSLINTFSVAGASVGEFEDSLREVSGTLDELYQNSITTSEKLDYMLSGKAADYGYVRSMQEMQKSTSDFQTVIDNTAMSTDNLAGYIMDNRVALNTFNGQIEGGTVTWNKWTGMIESVTDAATDTTYTFDKFGKLVSITEGDVTRNVRNIEDAFSNMADNIEDDYQDIVDTLSTPIPLKISAPAIGYSGNTSIGFAPYESGRYTFARAYEQAMILSAPTIFGAMGNNLLVGGDRPGNEIVVGESHLLDMMSKVMNRSGGIVVNVYGAEGQSENAIADFVIDKLQRELINSEVF